MKKVVVFLQPPIPAEASERLKKVAEVAAFPSEVGMQVVASGEVLEKIKEANILFSNCTINEDLLCVAKRLEYIQRHSIGYDNVDVEACTRHGVIFCNVAGVMSESVAQHNVALILALSKKIVTADRMLRTGKKWRESGFQLWEKTIGIIGLGAIGQRVAMKMKYAFNMRVLVFDPYILPTVAEQFGGELVDLKTLMKESNVVSINCALTKETFHLIGEEEFKLMRNDAVIVNTARGAIINEEALVKALKEKKIAGAGLDVVEKEPINQDNPLFGFDNVVITDHLASETPEAVRKTREGSMSNIERYIQGERPFWIVNPTVLNKKRD